MHEFEINMKYGDQFIYWGQINENREYHGIGRLESADGRIVEGQFKNSKTHGFAICITGKNSYYVGEW